MRRAMFTPTLFGIILLSSIAEAVNIPVGGIVQAPCGGDLPCLTLTGPDFSLVARQRVVNQTLVGIPGRDISLNATIIVDRFATLTFQGINYLPGLGEPTGPVGQIFGTLFLSTPPVRFSEIPPQLVQLTAPAALSANPANLVGQNPVTNESVTFDVSGFGSATGIFIRCPQCSTPGAFSMEQIKYEFTTVPEPAAGLVIAAGFVALLLFRKQLM